MNAIQSFETLEEATRSTAQRMLEHRALQRVSPLDEIESPVARVESLGRALIRRARARPFFSVAVAVGVGFVIGGALSFRAGRMALAAVVRHVTRELLKQVL